MTDQPPRLPSTGSNPYAPPTTHVDDVPPDGAPELAARGIRLVATIIDALSFGLLGVVAAIVVPMFKGGVGGIVLVGSVAVVGVLVILGLNMLWIHQRGQTIGKRLMSIKTVRADGSRCGLRRVFFLRYLPITILGVILGSSPYLGLLLYVVDSVLIFRESRQCLHDQIADTIVVVA